MVVLIVLTVGTYAPVLHHGFVEYDDQKYVTQNRHVTTGLTADNLVWAFTSGDEANWHPLTWISHMIDVELYGMQGGLHHLTSLFLHILNTLLLFALLQRVTGALGRSLFIASLFAVHPLHVESVAWVAERKDVLSTLFWMLALNAYVIYTQQEPKRRVHWYLVVAGFFTLGLMAKPMVITLPFVLLLLDFWPLGRIDVSNFRSRIPSLVMEKVPLIGISVVSGIVTFFVQQRGGTLYSFDRLSLKLRIGNAVQSYVAYIGSMIWPSGLAAFYPFPLSISAVWFGCTLLLLAGITAGAFVAARRYPYFPVGWFWYLGTLVPVIGLVQAGSQARADRYTYIPLIGLFIIAAWGLSDLVRRSQSAQKVLCVAACLSVFSFAVAARAQLGYWENSFALWSHALEVTRDNGVANNNMGLALVRAGKLEEATDHFFKAVQFQPNLADAHNNLGNALVNEGKIQEAIVQYRDAIQLNPNYSEAHFNLANILVDAGRLDEAVKEFAETLRANPEDSEAYRNLGIALARLGKNTDAMRNLTRALQLNPSDMTTRISLEKLKSEATK